MSLKDIVDLKTKVEVSEDVSFDVRGLSTEDLAILSGAYDKYLDSMFKGELDFGKLIKEAPSFVAKVLALATDEPESVEYASKLPFGIQVKALKSVYDLTFPDEDFLGELVNQLTEVLQNLQAKLVSGSGPEEETSTVGEESLSKQSSA